MKEDEMNKVFAVLGSKRNRAIIGAAVAGLGFLMALSGVGAISAAPIVIGIVFLISSQGASGPRQYN
jgi:hypothetical protein